jgi:hypothetical protein
MTFSQHLTNPDVFPQFIVSKITKEADGLTYKYPCAPTGHKASIKDRKIWRTLKEIEAHVARLGPAFRVGYSITKETKLFFLDIDKAYDPETKTWSPLAIELYSLFRSFGCYIEVSQSGTGLHILGRYSGEVLHKCKNTKLNIELYTDDRFVMLTGIQMEGDWSVDASIPLHTLIKSYFAPELASKDVNDKLASKEVISDEEVIRRARATKGSKEAFGRGASFDDFYENNEEVLAREYPPQGAGKVYDGNGVDLAFANKIAAHTRDKDQIIRIMKGSKLAREKWDRETYLLSTAVKALDSRSSSQLAQSNTQDDANQASMPEEYLGCYYIHDAKEIYSTLHGRLLNQEAFNLCFGRVALPELPYKTFRKHAAMCGHVIDHVGFKPHLPHGAITEHEGGKSINSYKPLKIKTCKGDVGPFFELLNAAFPDKRDQRIILSYAAVMAQKPGVKSQWCLVLQGVQGCGKSLLADFIAYACGETYTHRAKGDEFENRFNSQWFGKTLILIEDPRLQSAKLEEMLKPLVTSSVLAFEGKGKNVQMNDFPANFILTLNDFNLLQKKADSRRLAVFMSKLQTPEDLIRAGMTPTRFRRIVDWKNNGGYEIVADYLLTYEVDPEFDFSGNCVTAPETSTTGAAIECSRPEIETVLLDEIEMGRIGFKDGWISSTLLTDFLAMNRLSYLMPRNQRKQILNSLGYVHHPGLLEGRAIRNVLPENKRSTLFVKKGHHTTGIIDREIIMRAYEDAQK